MKTTYSIILVFAFLFVPCLAHSQDSEKPESDKAQLWCTYPGGDGIGKDKHIVLIAGDDEYRSEECLPMLGKILSVRHGFKCTVLFPINDKNEIQPNHQTNIPGMKQLESADLVVLGLRFRHLPNEDMQYLSDYLDAGKPVIGVRTSTHAFNFDKEPDSNFKHWSWRSKEKDWEGGFGQQVFGDTWVNHHGRHGKQSTRGVAREENKSHPILKGVDDVWGPSDVYGIVRLPKTATVLLDGAVIENMEPTGKPVEGKLNEPMMPVAWTKTFKGKNGKENRVFCTTMGAATDFESEGLRRLVVNACLWGMEMEDQIPDESDVDYVGSYKPTKFGFGNFIKGTTPADYNLPTEK